MNNTLREPQNKLAQWPTTLIVLDSSRIKRLKYDDGARQLRTAPGVRIIPSDDNTDDPVIKNLHQRGMMEHGTILVHSPFEQEHYYEELSCVPYEFAYKKYMYFASFCNLLGAKEFSIHLLNASNQTSRASYTVNATSFSIMTNVATSIQNDQHNNFLSRLQVRFDFSGSKPLLNEAESFLRKHSLLGDTTMNTLLEQRQSTNTLKAFESTLNLSVETKKVINIVGRLIIPPYIIADGKHNNVVREMFEYCLKVQVNF